MDTTTTTGRASMLDGNARRVLQCLAAAEPLPGATDITTDGHDPATGPECGPVRVFRLETRQGKGQAR